MKGEEFKQSEWFLRMNAVQQKIVEMYDIVILGVLGSQGHGLSTQKSDLDLMGIFMMPFDDLLLEKERGLRMHIATREENGVDLTLYDFKYYLHLIKKGSPNIIELMFLPSYLLCKEEGKELLSNKDEFFNWENIKNAYIGYLLSEKTALRIDDPLKKKKSIRHCYRLMLQGEEILRTGNINVKISNPEEFMKQVDLFFNNEQLFNETIEQGIAKMDSMVFQPTSKEVNENIDKFTLKIRKNYYLQKKRIDGLE